MRKILTFLFAALMSVGMWAETVIWYGWAITPGESFSQGGVTITCSITGGEGDPVSISSPGTFTSSIGNFTKIEINANEENLSGAGWVDDDYWIGNASSVEFNGYINGISQIKFTIEDAAPTNPSGSCGTNLSWEFNPSTGVLTISGTGDMYDYDDYENPAPWFSSKESITSVIISNGVTRIGESAFYGCSGLTSITIPNSVISIGDWAFAFCSGLTSITIPNSVTSIGEYAFYECSGLTSIEIPNSVTSIGESAFYECSGLTSITIPNSVISIGDWAFAFCSGLTSITIPNSVTSIGEGAFDNCSGLTSVTIGNSVTSIGNFAFYWCTGLTSIEIPNSVEYIGIDAFFGCTITDVYCYPNAADLTWEEGGCDDFILEGDKTVCHVFASELTAYQAKFTGTVNVTFEDDLPAPTPTPTDEQVPTNEDPENPGVYYYSTFFHSTQNYKLSNDGTTAFIADLSGNDLILTEIAKGSQVIPANTAVILRKAGSAEPVALTPTEENGVSVNPDENSLEGVDAITAVTSIDGLTRANCYVLSGQEGVGFYLINSDNLKAHKAYVKYVSTPGQGNAPRRMRFVFEQENTTTGVESAQPSVISGQKLIENGQLIIIKNGVRYNAQGQIVK